MSSTNRKVREGHDFFETPAWCVERLLETGALDPWPGMAPWLEPAAGRGAIVRACDAYWDTQRWFFKPKWRLIEIDSAHIDACAALLDETRMSFLWADFLKTAPQPGSVSTIITNPPFDLAPRFIEQAFKWKPQKIVLLLRLNFLATEARAPFMRQYAPDVYVLPNRPAFTGKGTDSIEYAWFVWDLAQMPRAVGTVQVLAPTPVEVRRRKAA